MVDFRINPEVKPEYYAEVFSSKKYVQIHNFLEAGAADFLHETLSSKTMWRLCFSTGQDRPVLLSQAELSATSSRERADLQQRIYSLARRNEGFMYSAWPMITAYLEGWDGDHPLNRFTEFLQSAEVREFGRKVIGADRITKVDAQATLYGPGHFLTRHRDVGLKQERRAAYTLGLARNWEPDFGGLLAFIDDDLNISRALTPNYNVLTLFDGLLPHSVTAVAPFAPIGRYSITGWFRDDPPVARI